MRDIQENIRKAITFYIDLMLEHGSPISEPKILIDQAIDCHNNDLAECYKELAKPIRDSPAIVELVMVDPSPESILRDDSHLVPELLPVTSLEV